MDRHLLHVQDGVAVACEEVEVQGHIIDSLILPKILDCILNNGGTFRIKRIAIGQSRHDPSHALLEVRADDRATLERILAQIADHGAVPVANAGLPAGGGRHRGGLSRGLLQHHEPADGGAAGGASGSRSRTRRWTAASWSTPAVARRPLPADERVPAAATRSWWGTWGCGCFPSSARADAQPFAFMDSGVSTEKPKGLAIREIARDLAQHRAAGGKTLLVGGPAIIHTGSGEFLQRLIRMGYIDVLFAGNALATHDIEQAMFGTSLGVYLDREGLAEAGHEHHLRAINRIRRAGGIRQAVESGLLTSGVMYECVRCGVDFLLAGSIRDDGPLPDVITDVLVAQKNAGEDPRRHLLPDDRHHAALRSPWATSCPPGSKSCAPTSTPRRSSSFPIAARSRPSAW